MLKPRVIPCLLLRGRGLYKTVKFGDPKYVGDPVNAVKIFNEKEVDELLLLDITATPEKRERFDHVAAAVTNKVVYVTDVAVGDARAGRDAVGPGP